MSNPRYPTGEEIHAGDRLLFDGRPATILFVTERGEFARGVSPVDWDFVKGNTIGVLFEDDGNIAMYDSFCHHDSINFLSRAQAT